MDEVSQSLHTLLEVKELEVSFMNQDGKKKVVDQISFSVEEGELLGIVGESGSGKSMTALAILGLLKEKAIVEKGSIFFNGRDLLQLDLEELRKIKGSEISMIFQEPMTSLNPLQRVGKQIEEAIYIHENCSKESGKERTLLALKEAGFDEPEEIYGKYPHQLSGGMRQRVMIALAYVNHPKLLIADEPTTALDVTVQRKILELIQKLNKMYHMAVIFVSHDLAVVQELCDRAIVMKDGRIIEEGKVEEIFHKPKNEYTKQLIHAIPKRRETAKEYDVDKRELSKERQIVLSVEHLNAYYDVYEKKSIIQKKHQIKQVVQDVSLQLEKGQILGIVGESGSGKTTLVKSILGLTKKYEGSIKKNGNTIQMVFQDPYSSLNPCKRIGWLLEEPLKMKTKMNREQRKREVENMIEKVGLSKEYLSRYPSDLSGGQRQRIAIAMALITKPEIIILDEPVSALDVTVQVQILELLEHLRDEFQLSLLFISHDLNVIAQICDCALVLYQGKVVEEGTICDIFDEPKHEYTKCLLGNKL